jgi:thioredoxin 1
MTKELLIPIKEADFEEKILKSPHPVVVDFWAEWCGPCRELKPILEKIAKKMEGKISFFAVDVSAESGIASRYHVRSIPTLIAFHKGNIVDQRVGGGPEAALTKWLDSAFSSQDS